MGLALTVVLILGGALQRMSARPACAWPCWISLGLLCSAFFSYGITVIVLLVAVLVLANLFVRGGAETVAACRDALADGARQALPVGIACAVVGIVIGTMTLTGVGSIFGNWVVEIGEGLDAWRW